MIIDFEVSEGKCITICPNNEKYSNLKTTTGKAEVEYKTRLVGSVSCFLCEYFGKRINNNQVKCIK